MRNRYGKIFIACGVVAVLSLGTSAVAKAQTITDLGATDVTLGFDFRGGVNSPAVTAINNIGQVVGSFVTANGDVHAALWQKDSQGNYSITDLGTLGGAGTLSRAFGINTAGQVVGSVVTADGDERAALWQKDLQGNYSITDLGTLGGTQSTARAINDAGQVVGSAFTANGEQHAALWQKDSQGIYSITDLRTLGGVAVFSQAFGINAAGQVVGVTSTPPFGVPHAFLWQNGMMSDLGTLLPQCGVGSGCGFSQAFAINAAGQVVGHSFLNPTGRAFLWQNGEMTDLGMLRDGKTYSVALGINAAGQVVGDSNSLGPNGQVDGIQHAELWQKDSQGAYSRTDLDTLLPAGSGWKRLIAASAINDRGQIVGLGEFSDGLIHRYLLGPSIDLLDPVPELLAGAAVTTDKELLASKGRQVLGVATDGVAQLVIRIPAKSAGEQFMLTVLNAQQVESINQDEDGAVADVINARFGSSVTVTAQDTAQGPMAFALYLAPRDFARSCNSSPCQSDIDATSREVTLQLQTGNTINTVPIKIVRPPVMLIHGLWSQPSVWNNFPLTSNPRFQTSRADYKETNGESIEINTLNVEAELDIDLREFKSVSKVAAVQFDLVTHSMGGLIARNLATLNSYRRVSNYRAGDIHKLITLDTPHLGSQFANRLDAASPLCRFAFNAIGKKIGGAVKDLEVGSAAIAKLLGPTTPIKARLIAGQATVNQELQSTLVFEAGTSVLAGLCRSLLPLGGFPVVFSTPEDPEGHSDLVVSVVSQVGKTIAVGRRDPPADAPYIGIEHTKVPVIFPGPTAHDDPGIGQRVIDLLNSSVATPDFGDILP